MIRLLLRLFNIRDYEICQSCETLKEQLKYERAEKAELTKTLLNIIHPKAVEAAPIEINPITQSSTIFSRKRAALEARDREEAKILIERKNIGVSDNSIGKLELELGINSENLEEKKEA